jgi:hypothetical protein
MDLSCPKSTWPVRRPNGPRDTAPLRCGSRSTRGTPHRRDPHRMDRGRGGGVENGLCRRPPERAADGSEPGFAGFPPCATSERFSGSPPGHVRDVTIQRCRSKDRVVRLEPFFGDAPVEPKKGAPGVCRGCVLPPGGAFSGGPAQPGRCGRLELHRDPLGNARFLHGHAVQRAGRGHRLFGVGHHDELGG